MIRLATCFSGIGAIEHALKRMGLPYEIVFACDNGEVDILTKHIPVDAEEISSELRTLDRLIAELQFDDGVEDLYKEQLANMLREADREAKNVMQAMKRLPPLDMDRAVRFVDMALRCAVLPKAREREYRAFRAKMQAGKGISSKLAVLQLTEKLQHDRKKIFSGVDEKDAAFVQTAMKEMAAYVEGACGKRLLRTMQDLAQRTSQLHEKINYMKVQRELDAMGEDWARRKAYVDALYQGLESRNRVRTSYFANYAISEQDYHWNIAFLDGRQYRGKVDLFVGGSPCQSFSLVGKQRGLEDTRGTLFYEYARLIDEVRPKAFLYENVKAVLSHDRGRTWAKMQEVFASLGYRYSWRVLNAKDYGIPQNRERLFVVGFRSDLPKERAFSFPAPVPLERHMKDFLLDAVPGGYFLPRKGVDFVTDEKNLTKKFTQIDGKIQLCQKKNQEFNWHGDFVFQSEKEAEEKQIPDLEKYFLSEKVRKYVLAPGTKNFYSRPKTDLDIARPLLTTMHKMHRAGVDNYVTTDGRLRKLTPRECLRLMGFSDSFRIVVSDTAMYQQAGNSIVVDVLIHIVECMLGACPAIGRGLEDAEDFPGRKIV